MHRIPHPLFKNSGSATGCNDYTTARCPIGTSVFGDSLSNFFASKKLTGYQQTSLQNNLLLAAWPGRRSWAGGLSLIYA